MKEFPQESCTNCSKDATNWCVCKKCRNNGKIIKRLDKKIKEFEETLDRIGTPTVSAGLGITKMMEELAILRTIRGKTKQTGSKA